MYRLLYLFSTVIDIAQWLIVIRCILSWFPNFNNGFTDLIYKLTQPMLSPVRRLLDRFVRPGAIVFDISPVVLYFLLQLLRRIVYMLF